MKRSWATFRSGRRRSGRKTADLKLLIEANTTLTQEDKALTEKVEALTREIHARLLPV